MKLAAENVVAERYRLGVQLGVGGMGVVYEAEDLREQRVVALKILSSQHTADPRAVARMALEARLLSTISHPNLLRVFDFAEDGRLGCWFVVMERLRGRDLSQAASGRPMSVPEVVEIVCGALRGLAVAHSAGVVHRDLKPTNLFLAEEEGGQVTVKLLDFGVAKIFDGGAAQHLTQTGMIVGTPEFMAPEQALGRPLDARTDLYATGCVAYFAAAGRPPFAASRAIDIMTAHVEATAEPLHRLRPEVSGMHSLSAVVTRAMAKDPDARFQSAVEMLEAVKAIGGDAPPIAPEPPATRASTRRVGGTIDASFLIGLLWSALAGIATSALLRVLLRGWR
jgi:serine/threonine-protein kinase